MSSSSATVAYESGFSHDLDAEPCPHKPGDVLGAYRLDQLLGHGGMGFVFAAEHIKLGRLVALKMLRPEYAQHPQAVARFFREARAVNKINHEHIVAITDFVEEGGSDKYCVMELLEGETLHQLASRGERLSLRRVLDIAVQVAEALGAAHTCGFVHRDLKPENVFLTTRGGRSDFVKILDFGVAKLSVAPAAGGLGRTAAGMVLGTPEYMSPEQAAAADVDHRSDMYSLGIILYELVTGRKPFKGKSFGELLVQHMTLIPERPSRCPGLLAALPPALESLILECLEKDPADRPLSMDAISLALREILAEEIRAPAPAPRRSRRPLAIGAALLVIAGASAWALLRTPQTPPSLSQAAVVEVPRPSAPPPGTAPRVEEARPMQHRGHDAAPRYNKTKRKVGKPSDRNAVLDPFNAD